MNQEAVTERATRMVRTCTLERARQIVKGVASIEKVEEIMVLRDCRNRVKSDDKR